MKRSLICSWLKQKIDLKEEVPAQDILKIVVVPAMTSSLTRERELAKTIKILNILAIYDPSSLELAIQNDLLSICAECSQKSCGKLRREATEFMEIVFQNIGDKIDI
jgi:hypothetical protein